MPQRADVNRISPTLAGRVRMSRSASLNAVAMAWRTGDARRRIPGSGLLRIRAPLALESWFVPQRIGPHLYITGSGMASSVAINSHSRGVADIDGALEIQRR